jgi:hypothetical protein
MQFEGGKGNRRLAAVMTAVVVLVTLLPRMILSGEAPTVTPHDGYPEYSRCEYRRFLASIAGRAATPVENYLAARSLQKMRLFTNAAARFETVSTNGLPGDLAEFLNEASAFWELRAWNSCLVNNNRFPVAGCSVVTNLLGRIPPASPYYLDALDVWLYWNYRASNYTALAAQNFPGPRAAAYRSWARFRRGESGAALSVVPGREYLNSAMRMSFGIALSNVPPEAAPDVCDALLDIALDSGNLALAERAIDSHFAKTGDADYALRNRARLLYRRGDKAGAIAALVRQSDEGKASIQTVKLLYYYQSAGGDLPGASRALSNAVTRWGEIFYPDWIKAFTTRNDWKGLAEWAIPLCAKPTFSTNWSGRIYRALLQSDTNLAADFCLAAATNAGPRRMRLYAALTLLGRGMTNSAYPLFLSVTLDDAYTWDWLAARSYEASLRRYFPGVFADTVKSLAAKYTLKQMSDPDGDADSLRFWSSLSETDPALWASLADRGKLASAYTKFTISQIARLGSLDAAEIKRADAFFSRTNGFIPALGADWVDRAERSWNDPQKKATLFWRHRDFYHDFVPVGAVLDRLNYYLNDDTGERSIHPLLEPWLFQMLYPKEAFTDILAGAGNTNRALWLLSAFREESHFSQADNSWAGAVGFCQLMPGTADGIKRGLKHPEYSIYDRADNIEMGTAHMAYLFQRFGDDPLAALASYNAGEGSYLHWKRIYGLPDEFFLEAMDYGETREYVRRIEMTKYFYQRAWPEGL